MSFYTKLAKARLRVHWDIDNPHAENNCGCKICCQERPIYNMHDLMFQEMKLEVKTRVCNRKSCLRYGCDCDD